MTEKSKGRILVVDDELLYANLLRSVLEQNGYQVLDANDGESALKAVQKETPDVVLLDVVMPGMDGFEVCRRVKQDPATAPIPVLIVTSLSDREYRLKGIAAGASDFLSKPIDSEEVLLRVSNMVHVKRLHDSQQEQFRALQALEALRDNLVHMIVHDMRNPLMAIQTVLALELKRKPGLTPDVHSRLARAQDVTRYLVEMVSSLLDVSRLEASQMPLRRTRFDLLSALRGAVESVGVLAGDKAIKLSVTGSDLGVTADRDLVHRVVVNLVTNAVKFTPQEGSITVTVAPAGADVRITVKDTGYGIPPEYHDKIFEKFGQVAGRGETRKYSTGIGLTFARLAVEAHGGRIGVESAVGKGSTFWFTLPGDQARA